MSVSRSGVPLAAHLGLGEVVVRAHEVGREEGLRRPQAGEEAVRAQHQRLVGRAHGGSLTDLRALSPQLMRRARFFPGGVRCSAASRQAHYRPQRRGGAAARGDYSV
ncbi:hypothetical protein EYF80_060226 [Liparis tanakae]|uniref:Uncharacterized protein n=1 Tax=Liparis tanakae TaxID=230148 RepID=A0A4Z2EL64_9TELE|nr:hypothetical protein EYF80_060226 [Liparis tanakae]